MADQQFLNGQSYSYLNMNPGDYIWNQPGKLSPYAQQQTGAINADKSALEANRAEALRSGPSAWRNMLSQSLQSQQKQGLNNAAQAAAGQTAQAEANLASHGGLSSGARERLAAQGGNNYLNMAQDVNNQAGQGMLNADIQDEQNRMSQLRAQPGMEIAATAPELAKANMNIGAQQYDLNNNINSFDKLNYANLQKYNSQMGAWAAGQQAQATQNSGKKQ